MSLQSERLRKDAEGYYIHDQTPLSAHHAHRGSPFFWVYDGTLGLCVVQPTGQVNEPSPVLAEGIWCEGCGYFEEDIDFAAGKCPQCGCSTGEHVPAKVVRA